MKREEVPAARSIVRVNKNAKGKNKLGTGKVTNKGVNKVRRNTMIADSKTTAAMIIEEAKEEKRKALLSPHDIPKRTQSVSKGSSKASRKRSDPFP